MNGQMVIQAGDLDVRVNRIQTNLNDDHAVELLCSIHAGWPGKKMKLEIPQVSLKTDGPVSLGDSGTVCSLDVENADFESPEGILQDLSVKTKLFYQYPLGKLSFSGLAIGSRKAMLGMEETKKMDFSGFSLTSDGEIDLKKGSLQASPLACEVPELLHLKGKLNAEWNAEPGASRRVRWEMSEGTIFPGRLLPFIGQRIAPYSATMSGAVSLAGAVSGFEEDGKWVWDCGLNASFEENGVSVVEGERRFQGKLSGEARVDGRYPHLKEAVRLHLRDASFSGNGFLLPSFEISLSFTGAYPQYHVNDFSVLMPRAAITSGKKVVSLSDVTMKTGEGDVNSETGMVSFPEVSLDSSFLKNIRLSLKSDQEGTEAEITGKETGLIQSARDLGWLPRQWTFKGEDHIEIKAVLKKDGECSVASQAVIEKAAFQNPDGDRAGDKISFKVRLNGKTDLSFKKIDFDASLSAEKGEVLWGRYYVDLSNHPMNILSEGRYDVSRRKSSCSPVPRSGFRRS